jgi:hypothetical protein
VPRISALARFEAILDIISAPVFQPPGSAIR